MDPAAAADDDEVEYEDDVGGIASGIRCCEARHAVASWSSCTNPMRERGKRTPAAANVRMALV